MSLRYADFFRGARGVSGAKELFTTYEFFRGARGAALCVRGVSGAKELRPAPRRRKARAPACSFLQARAAASRKASKGPALWCFGIAGPLTTQFLCCASRVPLKPRRAALLPTIVNYPRVNAAVPKKRRDGFVKKLAAQVGLLGSPGQCGAVYMPPERPPRGLGISNPHDKTRTLASILNTAIEEVTTSA